MRLRPVLLGTLAYLLVTFPLAIVWHMVLFRPFYDSVGYLGTSPKVELGFLAILIQGIVLSMGFGFCRFQGAGLVRGLKYALLMGVFFWTGHVLAFAAKNSGSDTPWFYVFETVYLALQFGVYGILIGRLSGSGNGD